MRVSDVGLQMRVLEVRAGKGGRLGIYNSPLVERTALMSTLRRVPRIIHDNVLHAILR